jgi:hypothetical protein
MMTGFLRLSGCTDWLNGRDEADAITASVHGLLSACTRVHTFLSGLYTLFRAAKRVTIMRGLVFLRRKKKNYTKPVPNYNSFNFFNLSLTTHLIQKIM